MRGHTAALAMPVGERAADLIDNRAAVPSRVAAGSGRERGAL